MKKTLVTSMLAVALLAGASASHAQSLNFNLTGTILPGTCSFTANDVDLGTYLATLFTGSYVTPFVDVPITSTNCAALVTTIHMAVSGTADTANAAYFRGIAGVGIELQQKTGSKAIVPAGTTVDFAPVRPTGTYLLQARFHQSAATVASGTVRSPVTVNFTYN